MRHLLPWLLPRLMLGLAVWRVLRGQESWRDLSERRGFGGAEGAIWVHGASNGELASARWVIAALAERGEVLVTSSTVSGREMVRGWGVRAALAPLDLGPALRRFGRPRAFVNLEGEIWPARFARMAALGVPVAWIGARMSERTARFWASAGAPDWRAVRLVSAQDGASEARLRALGVGAWVAPCDLKAEAAVRTTVAPWAPRATRARVLLAASTHAGEEEAVLDAFLASDFGLLILAPRHPRRGDEIARMLASRGVSFARRSTGETFKTQGPRVYLADTLGEMPMWYGLAGACFVGGSLVDKGGHTPWEPLMRGCALLHGPHVANFAATYAALDAIGAARQGLDLVGLDGATQDRMAALALSLPRGGAGDALLGAIFAVIDEK